jgi:hypothetical protein
MGKMKEKSVGGGFMLSIVNVPITIVQTRPHPPVAFRSLGCRWGWAGSYVRIASPTEKVNFRFESIA